MSQNWPKKTKKKKKKTMLLPLCFVKKKTSTKQTNSLIGRYLLDEIFYLPIQYPLTPHPSIFFFIFFPLLLDGVFLIFSMKFFQNSDLSKQKNIL
jgi:hypothetical protein